MSSDLRSQSDSTYILTRIDGPYKIGKDSSITVFAKITRVHLGNPREPEWPDSDTSLMLVTSENRILYSIKEIPLGDGDRNYKCTQLFFPTFGNVVSFNRSYAPSDPSDHGSTQLFALDSRSRLISLAGVLPEIPSAIVFLDSRNLDKPVVVDSKSRFAKPFIETDLWLESFMTRAYYPIFPMGIRGDTLAIMAPFRKLPVFVDAARAQRWRQSMHPDGKTVLLYKKPEDDPLKTVELLVRVDSKIKFLDVVHLAEWWLHVVIDGQEGYLDHDGWGHIGLPD
jgi:hypothetical protein